MDSSRLQRVLDLVAYLAGVEHGRTLSEIRRALDVPVSSAHDLIRGLVEIDAVVQAPGKRYRLGPASLRLGARIVDGAGVCRAARPHLRALVDQLGDDVHLAVRAGKHVVYVDRYPGTRTVDADARLGEPLVLHATAAGKLFAAFDPEIRDAMWRAPMCRLTEHTIVEPHRLEQELLLIRRQRLSVSRQERLEGVVGLAAPVRGPDTSLVAAVHVGALREQLPLVRRRAVVQQLSAAAHAVAADLERRAGAEQAA